MWLKPFLTEKYYYLYATESNEIFQVDYDLYDYLSSSAPDEEKYALAMQLGIVSTEHHGIDIFDNHLIDRGLDRLKQEGPTHLALSVTEACNFRCRYCAYSGSYDYARQHSSNSMSAITASKAIRWYFSFQRKDYHIGFYGGEPLLKHKLIRKIIDESWTLLPSEAKLTFGMTTNGSLINKSLASFLAQNRIELFISLDGSSEYHDRYRLTRRQMPSFDIVWKNIQNLQQRYPNYYRKYVNFSITLAPPNKPEAVRTFIQQHPETFGNLTPKVGMLSSASSRLTKDLGITFCQVDTSAIRKDYLRQMVSNGRADGFSRACAEATFHRLHNREMGSMPTIVTSAGQCVPGMRCHVASNGKLHMCEHGDEHWPIGDVDKGFNYERISTILRMFHQHLQPRCGQCWGARLCRKCIPQLAEGSMLSPLRLVNLCQSRQHSMEQDLIDYCSAQEQNPRCFDTLALNLDENLV
jgi:uncharacterized protein